MADTTKTDLPDRVEYVEDALTFTVHKEVPPRVTIERRAASLPEHLKTWQDVVAEADARNSR